MDQCDCSYVVIPMALVNLAGTVLAIVISKYIDRVTCEVPESDSGHDESDSEENLEDNLSDSCEESGGDSGDSGNSEDSEGSGDDSGDSEDSGEDSGDDSGDESEESEDENRQDEPENKSGEEHGQPDEEINKDSIQSLIQENKTSISDEELITLAREVKNGVDGFDHGALRGVLVKLTEEGNRLINQPSFVPDGKTEFIMGVVGDIPELFNKLDQNDPGVKAILTRKALDVAKILNQNEFDPLSNSVESGSPKRQHESEFLMKTLDSLQ